MLANSMITIIFSKFSFLIYCFQIFVLSALCGTAASCLRELAHHIFFLDKIENVENTELLKNEIMTQKEVIFNMMMKFIREVEVSFLIHILITNMINRLPQ